MAHDIGTAEPDVQPVWRERLPLWQSCMNREAQMEFTEGEGRVTVAVSDGVADVRLDRPDKLNALDRGMFANIAAAIEWLGGQEEVRCAVISGEGRSFSAGIDVSVLGEGVGALSPRSHGIANALQFCAWGWRELPVPVIAAIHGHCFGAGIQVALGADIRIAAPDAEISIMEMRHGLVPDMGAFALSRGVVREDAMRELVYTARRISGEDAKTLGLVTRTAIDPLATARDLAREIAGQSPAAIRAAKRLFGQMAEADPAAILQAESNEEDALIAAIREPEA
jgi:enoyl-CoA hydratase/carnithine racemase